MLRIAGQTDGLIGLKFSVDTQGWLEGIYFFQKKISTGNGAIHLVMKKGVISSKTCIVILT